MATSGNGNQNAGAKEKRTLLPSDRKTVADARGYVRNQGMDVSESQRNFSKKGSIGLWWDQKGLFSSSDKTKVDENLEKYRQFYEEISTFTVQVDNCEEKCYADLLGIYDRLDQMEREAEYEEETNKSKTILARAREFLASKYELNHKLKRVECVVLRTKIDRFEESCRTSTETIAKMNETMQNLSLENQQFRSLLKDSNDKADKLAEESREFKILLEESNKRSEKRYQEMIEENQRTLEKLFQVVNAMLDHKKDDKKKSDDSETDDD